MPGAVRKVRQKTEGRQRLSIVGMISTSAATSVIHRLTPQG